MVSTGNGWAQGPPRARPHPTQGLTYFHAIGLHFLLILLVHGPHMAVEEARGIGDLVCSGTGKRDWQERVRPVSLEGGTTNRA